MNHKNKVGGSKMLGEKIHRLRKEKGYSQEELASQLTVSRQAISKWELGESMPDTENILQLSKLFGVSTDYLLNDNYKSDMDIPAVKTTYEKVQKSQKKIKVIVSSSIVLMIIGVSVLLYNITNRNIYLNAIGFALCGTPIGLVCGYAFNHFVFLKGKGRVCPSCGNIMIKRMNRTICSVCGFFYDDKSTHDKK